MQYFDEEKGAMRETLDNYLRKGERFEDVIFSLDECKHIWEECFHTQKEHLGNNPACGKDASYQWFSHFICKYCGRERHPDAWYEKAIAILKQRRERAENSQ